MMIHRLAAFAAALFLVTHSFCIAADWPGWRGPTGMGHTTEKELPLIWGGKEQVNVRWKAPLPGVERKAAQDQNQSSPIVVRGRVFVTASYWPMKQDPKEYPEHHVACYRADDGKLLWDVTIEPGPWKFGDLRGGYTAPTPAADAERVYVLFGSSVLAALDYDGKLVWRKEVVPYKFDVAIGVSPVLYKDTVILQCDEVDGQSRIFGYDRKTGGVKWEERRNSGFSHSTPVLATVRGKTQLLAAASNAVQGLDPASGKLLWWCAGQGDTVSPVLGGGVVYLDSGRGGGGVAVDPTGSGDVTKTHRKWSIGSVPEGFSSPIIVGEHLYRLHRPETLKCIELATGKVVYAERLAGVSTLSSPIATPDGKIYLASAGKSYVVQAGPTLNLLATSDLGDDGPASPAVADGCLYLKGRRMLYGIGKNSKP